MFGEDDLGYKGRIWLQLPLLWGCGDLMKLGVRSGLSMKLESRAIWPAESEGVYGFMMRRDQTVAVM